MRFEFEVPNVVLQDRLIIIEIKEIVKRQIELLSSLCRDELSWNITNLLNACDCLDAGWASKRRNEFANAIDEQYFELAEVEDEDSFA